MNDEEKIYSLLYQDSEIEDLQEIKKNFKMENDLQTNDSLLQGWSHSPDPTPIWNQAVSGAAASIAAFDPRPYGVEFTRPDKQYYDSRLQFLAMAVYVNFNSALHLYGCC